MCWPLARNFDGTPHSLMATCPDSRACPVGLHRAMTPSQTPQPGGAAGSSRRSPPSSPSPGLPGSPPRLRQPLSPGPPRTSSPPPLSRWQAPDSLLPQHRHHHHPPPFSFSPILLPALLPQGLALGPWARTWVCEWMGLKRQKAGSETSVVNLEGGWWTPGPAKKAKGPPVSSVTTPPSPGHRLLSGNLGRDGFTPGTVFIGKGGQLCPGFLHRPAKSCEGTTVCFRAPGAKVY